MTIMIFELEVTGHHPDYLRHLLNYMPDEERQVVFVVAPSFLVKYPNIVNAKKSSNIKWTTITPQEHQQYEHSKKSILRRTYIEWQLFTSYAKKTNADHGLVMYLDRFRLPLAFQFPTPCLVSGIFFRPSFYHLYPKTSFKLKLKQVLDKWILKSAFQHSKLKTFFSLDPMAVPSLKQLSKKTTIIPLPDPVEISPSIIGKTKKLRQSLGIDEGRKVLLLLGMLNRRKGIYEIIEALQRLPATAQKQLTLLLAGPLSASDSASIQTLLQQVSDTSLIQVILQNQYITNKEIQTYFDLSDIVLTLYQQHVGMSGIMIRAAAAGKPVISSNYGLMGALVEQHKLGVAINGEDTKAIAKQLINYLDTQKIGIFEQRMARKFAEANTAAQFAECLYYNLFNTTPSYN